MSVPWYLRGFLTLALRMLLLQDDAPLLWVRRAAGKAPESFVTCSSECLGPGIFLNGVSRKDADGSLAA